MKYLSFGYAMKPNMFYSFVLHLINKMSVVTYYIEFLSHNVTHNLKNTRQITSVALKSSKITEF